MVKRMHNQECPSKKNVRAVLERRDPDYIPLGLYTIDCDLASQILGRKTLVRDKIGQQIALWEGRRDELAESVKADAAELYRRLDCVDLILPAKCVPILPPRDYHPPKVRKLSEDTWECEDGYTYKAAFGTNEMVRIEAGKELPSAGDFSDFTFVPPDESIFEAYDYFIERLTGDRFICGHTGTFDVMVLPGGMERGLMQYYLDPDAVRAQVRWNLEQGNFLDRFYDRKGVDGFMMEQDFSTTLAPLMSVEMFRDFCFPAMRDRVTHVKKFGKKVILHSCGRTWAYLDMFVEAGFDCYQSLQTGVMDLGELKSRYGGSLAFWGGVPVEHLLRGTPADIRADVRKAMEAGRGRGGFILGPSHSVAYGTKYDNFMAMLDEHDRLKHTII